MSERPSTEEFADWLRGGNGQANGEAKPRKPKMSIEWFGEAADSALSEPAGQLIEGVLDEDGLAVIYGDSGGGKTFVALDIGFHIGAGLDWNSKKVRRGLVVYVAAEGGKRIKRRIAALPISTLPTAARRRASQPLRRPQTKA